VQQFLRANTRRLGVALYDMGRRITELVLRRNAALSLLYRAGNDRYVRAAIAILEGEPDPGEPGGPARDALDRQAIRVDSPFRQPRSRPAPRIVSRPRPQPRTRAQLGRDGLTRTERPIAQLVANGSSDAQIAAELQVSVDLVRGRITGMMTRLQLANRRALHKYVSQRQLRD
jgi:DNA-binding NarL/FixJ family response regulator